MTPEEIDAGILARLARLAALKRRLQSLYMPRLQLLASLATEVHARPRGYVYADPRPGGEGAPEGVLYFAAFYTFRPRPSRPHERSLCLGVAVSTDDPPPVACELGDRCYLAWYRAARIGNRLGLVSREIERQCSALRV